MAKKVTAWKPKGMNRDLSVSAFNAEYTFENINVRLSTNDNNTLMSWVNERGPFKMDREHTKIAIKPWLSIDWNTEEEEPTIGDDVHIDNGVSDDTIPVGSPVQYYINGKPLGVAVLNHKLVIFTKEAEVPRPDNIYVLWFDENFTRLKGERLYNGNLNFNLSYPIEAMVSYEAEDIQKVYWTDGLNQPRIININDREDIRLKKLKIWNYADKVRPQGKVDTFFDFVPDMNLADTFEVEKITSGNGSFSPGVIQYCYTYINKYGQQTNIVDVSPLFYLAHNDRGAEVEESVTNSFKITIKDVDPTFDYIRLYSIQRTSLETTPIVSIVEDIENTGNKITFVDNGAGSSAIDPYELLYVGGKEIAALTMTSKDQTLFIGNITEKTADVPDIQSYFDSIRETHPVSFKTDGDKVLTFDRATGYYSHTHELNHNSREITTFKGGETYRFGFQLQKNNGEWIDPVWIDDVLNDKYPQVTILGEGEDSAQLPYAEGTIDLRDSNLNLDLSLFKRIRPVVVYPDIIDRDVICQGVLNPTVFNVEDRKTNSPYAQASWFFRPYVLDGGRESIDPAAGFTVEKKTYVEGTDFIGIDPNFNSYSYHNVYVLIANVPVNNVDSILERGYLAVHQIDASTTNPYTSLEIMFTIGAIELPTEISGFKTFAFLSTNDYPYPGESADNANITNTYVEGLQDIRISKGVTSGDSSVEDTYVLYAGMRSTDKHLLFYPKVGDTNQYIFYFCAPDTSNPPVMEHYTVTFPGKEDTGYNIYTDNKDGGVAKFTHYDSLTTQDDIINNKNKLFDAEIQGSINTYANPYTKEVKSINYTHYDTFVRGTSFDGKGKSCSKKVESNTQYFVDQSIVTLNSPDLEFDTTVQKHSLENAKLRIVGIIPITANISSHRIVTNGRFLETNHNITKDKPDYTFGRGESGSDVAHRNIDINACRRLLSSYLWQDVFVLQKKKSDEFPDEISTKSYPYDYLIFPWHRKASLNNDTRDETVASSWLETKKESTALYSINSEYLTSFSNRSPIYPWNQNGLFSKIVLTENAEVMNYKLKSQRTATDSNGTTDINYYPNIDKVLYNKSQYRMVISNVPNTYDTVDVIADEDALQFLNKQVITPISIKYLSTTHAVIALQTIPSNSNEIAILPKALVDADPDVYVGNWSSPVNRDETFWGEKNLNFHQDSINISSKVSKDFGFLWLGELYKDTDTNTKFGGQTKEALKGNKWLIGGKSKPIENGEVTLQWTDGDTYYQRYDCLKTYPYTRDDPNQLVEILSFMCETHINLDGRYDRLRGQNKNYNMRPDIFNRLNPVYSQKNNFFTSRIVNIEDKNNHYPNQVYYSKTKQSGADVDLWTNVTLASILELDGDKGELNKLIKFNDQVLAFQDTGISQILYNERVQISTTQGVPVELANSGKVQGKSYFSDRVGCSNKWSLVSTPSGIYFVDSVGKNLYHFGGQLTNLSQDKGFNTWAKEFIREKDRWTPDNFDGIVTYYDKHNQDILFINRNTCLAYSEKLGTFTSFYDYGRTPYFINLDDEGLWLSQDLSDSSDNTTYLWRHCKGNYGRFFGVNKPYSMTFVGNPEPLLSKIFTNMEFRATVDGEEDHLPLPFDSIETWNEYQHGKMAIQNRDGVKALQHYLNDNITSLRRKFRIWRCDIPRDSTRKLERMRNPWLYLKLEKEAAANNQLLKRTEMHDFIMTYFV